MRICVYGAGAIGGWLAVRLASAGHEVSLVARGEHLVAIKARGLTLRSGDEELTVRVAAGEDPAELGAQDVVLVTLKATALTGLSVEPLLGPGTCVVFVQNGIPWWYGIGLSRDAPAPPDLSLLDPDGGLAALAPRVIGGVVKSMVEVIEPGIVLNRTPAIDSLVLGEPTDLQTPRLAALRAAIEGAGLPSPVTHHIREVVWNKLLMNMTGSVMCMLTGMTNWDMHHSPIFVDVLETLRREVQAIGAAHGCSIASLPPVERRVLSSHKPSILQDYERGRALELDAIVLAPLLFARKAAIATPSLDLMAALAVQKAAAAGLYTARPPFPF